MKTSLAGPGLLGLPLAVSLSISAIARDDYSEPRMARGIPQEWYFSDGVGGHFTEIERSLAKIMQGPRRGERVQAAALLWRNHSLVYAPEVLALAAQPEMTEEATDRDRLRVDIEDSLKPAALRRELKEGDVLWALRVAGLRPQPELTEDLLGELEARPHEGYAWSALVLALGKTGDRRALEPLLALLKDERPEIAGFAAEALGDLGLVEAEPELIEALKRQSTFVQAKAAGALGKIGTKAALPGLREIAGNKKSTGVIDTRRVAEQAVKRFSGRSGD